MNTTHTYNHDHYTRRREGPNRMPQRAWTTNIFVVASVMTMAPVRTFASPKVITFLESVEARMHKLESLSFSVTCRDMSDFPYGEPQKLELPNPICVIMDNKGRYRVELRDAHGALVNLVVNNGESIIEYSTESVLADENASWTEHGIDEAIPGARRRRLVQEPALLQFAEAWPGRNNALLAKLRNAVELADGAFVRKAHFRDRACWVLQLKKEVPQDSVTLTQDYRWFFDRTSLLPVAMREEISAKLFVLSLGKQLREYIYHDMILDADLPDDAFGFAPPENAVFISPDDERLRSHVPLGAPVPAVELTTTNGGHVKLSQFKDDKIVLLSFWSTTCAPCLREMPALIRLHEQFGGEDLAIIGVSIGDKPEKLRSFVSARKVPYIVAHDPERKIAAAFFVHGIPLTVLIDKKGIARRVWQGWSGEEQEKEIREALVELGIGKTAAAAGGGQDAGEPAGE